MDQRCLPGEDIPDLLRAWGTDDADALHKLTPLVYDKLRKLAGAYLRKERETHTLQRTALANEAFLRIAGNTRVGWPAGEMQMRPRSSIFRVPRKASSNPL